MKAMKVNEMIDPYNSEESSMDLDLSYKLKLAIQWIEKYMPHVDYNIVNSRIIINVFLNLRGTGIKYLPDNLTINGFLTLTDSDISKLPENLTVEDDLYIDNTNITSLPKSLIVKGKIYKDF